MKHIKQFKIFENDSRPVISYDFDGVLHKSVNGLDPIDFFDYESWVPFDKYHDKMREDAKTHRIVVVTARDNGEMTDAAWDFVKLYDLPVDDVIGTDDEPKYDVLKNIGAVKHYDDNPKMGPELKRLGIEFEQTFPLDELIEESTRFELVFTNPNFFISDNTLTAFVNRLRRMDPQLEYDPKMNGTMQGSRIIYAISKVLNFADIKAAKDEFVRKYDALQMQILPKTVNENKELENWFKLKQLRKAKNAESRAERKNNTVELTEEQILEYLKKVKARKIDMVDLPIFKALQRKGLVRAPRGVEIPSSFSVPFYLTERGEKFLKKG